MILTLVAFLCGSSLILLVFLLLSGRNQRADARMLDLGGEGRPSKPSGGMTGLAQKTLPTLAKPLVPGNEEVRVRLRSRLIHAGLYGRHAMGIFLGIKMLLMVVPLLLGLLAVAVGLVPFLWGLIYGLMGTGVGIILPGCWLDYRKNQRQTNLRRALPDGLDVIVICLEGGVSLQGALQRVTGSLRSAHPMLSDELTIVQREIQLGRSTGEALRQFADRCDLEELRSLAAVVLQAERLGASIVKTLRVHAEALRVKRLQRAEELAHMAGTKMVFPTLLCIFPAILFVIAGPAAFHILELFASMK